MRLDSDVQQSEAQRETRRKLQTTRRRSDCRCVVSSHPTCNLIETCTADLEANKIQRETKELCVMLPVATSNQAPEGFEIDCAEARVDDRVGTMSCRIKFTKSSTT